MTNVNRAENKNYLIWERSYRTEPMAKIESEVRSRTQALPGFPYISSRGAKMVHMAYALKLLVRANVMAALYASEDRNIKVQTDMANNTLRDIAHKDYIYVLRNEHGIGNMYAMGDVGFEFLGASPFDTEYTRTKLLSLYNINRVFNILCNDYREKYTLEWVTDPEFLSEYGSTTAASILWEQGEPKPVQSHLWLMLDTNFEMQQLNEVLRKQKEWIERLDSLTDHFPIMPDVYVVSSRVEDYVLKIVENGKACVDNMDARHWVLKR